MENNTPMSLAPLDEEGKVPQGEAVEASPMSLAPVQVKTEDDYLDDDTWIGYARTLEPRMGLINKSNATNEYMESFQGVPMPGLTNQPSLDEMEETRNKLMDEYEATDLEYAQALFSRIGHLKWNLPDLGMAAWGIEDWSEEEQVALIESMAIYDKIPTEMRHILRGLGGVTTDPTTYAGFGVFANALSKIGLKGGAAQLLKTLAAPTTTKGLTATAAIEGGLYTLADSVANQTIENKGDITKLDAKRTALETATGVGVAGTAGYFFARVFGAGPMFKGDKEADADLENLVESTENAEVFKLDSPDSVDDTVNRMENEGLLEHNPRVDEELEGELMDAGDGTQVATRQADASESTDVVDPTKVQSEHNSRPVDDNAVGEDWSHMYDGRRTFNIDRIETTEDVEAFIESSSAQWEKHRMAQADGNPDGVETLASAFAKSQEAAQALKDETGADIFKILDQYKGDHDELQKIRYRAQALRQLNVELGERLVDFAAKQQDGALTDKEKQMFMETAGLFSHVMELTKLQSREFSRGLGNYRLIMRGDPTLMEGLQTGKAMGDLDALSKTILGMTNAGRIKAEHLKKMTPKQRGKVLKGMAQGMKKSKFKSFMNELIRFRGAMMLSGPSTIESAALSNMAKLWSEPFFEWLGNLGFGTAKKQARQRAVAQYAGTRRFFADSWKQAAKAWKQGQHITDPFVTKMEDVADQNLQNMGWFRRNVWERGVHQANLALLFLDEGIKANRSRALVYSDTFIEAQKRGIKVNSEDFDKLLNENLMTKFDGNGRLRDKEILREVREATFTNELEGRIGTVFNTVSQMGGGAGRLIAIPFIRAPLNIVSEGLMYVPLPAFTARQLNIKKNGTPLQKQKLKARKMLGAAASGALLYAAEEELITGSGPSDYKQNKVWRDSGYEPYSIRVGDQWVSYAKLGPIGLYMGLMADINWIHKQSDESSNVPETLIHWAAGMQHAMTANVLNKAYFSSLNQLVDGIQDPDKNVDFWKNWVASFTPNLLAQMNDDPNVREATSFLEKIQRRIPVLSEKLGKQYDFYGREITKPHHDIPVYGYMFKNRQIVRDDVADEVYRLSNTLDRSILNKIPYSIGINQVDFRDVYDEGETESVYAKLNRYVGTTRDSRGRTLHEALEDLVNSSSYRRLPESSYTDITPPKAKMIQKLVNGYRERAKGKLMKESQAYRDTLRDQRQRKSSLF